MYSELTNTIEQLQHQSISEERKIILQPLIDFVQKKWMKEKILISILFVPTIHAEAIYHKSGRKQELPISIFQMYDVIRVVRKKPHYFQKWLRH